MPLCAPRVLGARHHCQQQQQQQRPEGANSSSSSTRHSQGERNSRQHHCCCRRRRPKTAANAHCAPFCARILLTNAHNNDNFARTNYCHHHTAAERTNEPQALKLCARDIHEPRTKERERKRERRGKAVFGPRTELETFEYRLVRTSEWPVAHAPTGCAGGTARWAAVQTAASAAPCDPP